MSVRSALTGSMVILGTLVVGIVIGVAASGSLAIPTVEAAQQGATPAAAPARCTTGTVRAESQPARECLAQTSRPIRAATRSGCTRPIGPEMAWASSRAASTSCTSGFARRKCRSSPGLGAQILGVWQRLDDPDTLVWMIVYRDRAHREQVWEAFNKDPEWDALRRKYFVPLKTNTFFMSAADYSPMK
jgi:hypothetical protein